MNICCFEDSHMIAHEIGHVLGMGHEHVRPDRRWYVSVKWQNIQPGAVVALQFRREKKMDMFGRYDFLSVMHYKQDNFSRNGLPTIRVLPPNSKYQSVIGMLPRLSKSDIRGMKLRYP
jgi:hypothetical protein